MLEEDAELMKMISSGDEMATRQVVNQHLGYVTGLANRLLNNREEAEDVAQDVFLKLWKQSGKWQPKAKISTWLYTVTRNASLDRLKKKKPIVSDELLKNRASSTTHSYMDQEAEREQASREGQLKKALDELSQKYREVLTCFYFENLSLKDSAKRFELSEDAYESLLRRARMKLKQTLNLG